MPRSPDHEWSREAAERATRELLLRAIRPPAGDSPSTERTFLLRRAATDIRDFDDPRERGALWRVLEAGHDADSSGALAEGLVGWAGYLETRGLFETAEAVLHVARELAPANPELTLHTARIARKRGRLDDARRLYDRVAELEGDEGELSIMASIGRALTSEERLQALGAILRRAIRRGAGEAAAVAQEERARARRAVSDVSGALRDYISAAARYTDPIDRGRVGHEVADLLIGTGDLEGARRALRETESIGHPEQSAFARVRLQNIARAQGDQLGVRRYAPDTPPPLVSLSPVARRHLRGSALPTEADVHPDRTRRVLGRGLARIASRLDGV